jgi:hypothetical protein
MPSSTRTNMKMSIPCLLGVVVYCVTLFGWHHFCAQHYAAQSKPRQIVAARSQLQAINVATQHSNPIMEATIKPADAGVVSAEDAVDEVATASTEPMLTSKRPATDTPTTGTPAAAISDAVAKAELNRDGVPACPGRKPIHCVLTAQGTTYQSWQARIMYYHWKKQAAIDGPCTDMTGFTRLVSSEDAKPDELEGEIPSVFVRSLTTAELATLGHFGVLNRPFSVVQACCRSSHPVRRISSSSLDACTALSCPCRPTTTAGHVLTLGMHGWRL